MIIDAHAHAAGEYSTAESIMNMVQKHEIEKIILCTSPKNIQDLQVPPNLPLKKSPDSNYLLNRMLKFAYTHFMKDNGDGNKYVFELKNKVPEKIIQFLWVNPLDKGHMTNIERSIHEYQPGGIKLHQAWDPFKIGKIEFNTLVDIAKSYKLPIFIHLYSKKETWRLLQFIKSNQDVVFIIGHMAGLDIFKADKSFLGNVFFDTSGSERVQGKDILKAINSFGYEHVVFGTDTPYAKIEDQINKIDQLNLSDNMKEHIFKLNISNILSL
jgi:predicted TIM-barrel fold metal-dependent hydrolase